METKEKDKIIESIIAAGDLSKLTPADRTKYYTEVCESLHLNPLTRPFEYITLNGKLVLYARKDCTDQLRRIHQVSVQIISRERIDDCYAVIARATVNHRTDESIGAVNIAGLKGDALCNALMKAETKAKRRVTLSICGMGMLDEIELETIYPQPVVAPMVAPIAPPLLPETTADIGFVPEQKRLGRKIGPKTREILEWILELGWSSKEFALFIRENFGLGVDENDELNAIAELQANKKSDLETLYIMLKAHVEKFHHDTIAA